MSYNIQFLTKAAADLQSSAQWYDEQQDGLGDRFITKVKSKLKFIANNPGIYKRLTGNKQQAVLDTFPFVVVFRVDKNRSILFILAVFHTSRHPKHKLRRD